jgi:glycerol uptake facilitator-like aquaporin
VVFKGIIAATASVALMVTPAVAAAQSSAQAATTEVAPAGETVTDGSQLRGGFIIPLIALIAIILGLLAATHDNDDDLPHSP